MIGDVEVREAGAKGLGVYALRAFEQGEFIFRRRNGRVLTYADLDKLPPDEREHFTELDEQRCALVLPPGAFLNHSCDPNAMRSGVKVFAWRPIAAGDEIVIDYRLNALGGDRWGCLCGAASCEGMVGDFFSMAEERQRAYLQFAPPFIRREWRRRRRE